MVLCHFIHLLILLNMAKSSQILFMSFSHYTSGQTLPFSLFDPSPLPPGNDDEETPPPPSMEDLQCVQCVLRKRKQKAAPHTQRLKANLALTGTMSFSYWHKQCRRITTSDKVPLRSWENDKARPLQDFVKVQAKTSSRCHTLTNTSSPLAAMSGCCFFTDHIFLLLPVCLLIEKIYWDAQHRIAPAFWQHSTEWTPAALT